VIEKKYQEHAKMLETIIKIIDAMGIRIIEMRDRHVKVLLPLEPNVNHIGTMYGGSLFTAGEFMGGAMYMASFDYDRFYPIVKAINIQFRRPALTNVTVEANLSLEEIDAIHREADAKGKADWKMDLEIKDEAGEVCCPRQGTWQLLKA